MRLYFKCFLRAAEDYSLEKGADAALRGKSRSHRRVRPANSLHHIRDQTSFDHSPSEVRPCEEPQSREVFARQHLRARRLHVSVLRKEISFRGFDVRSRGAGRTGGQKRWDNIVAACFRCNHKKGGRTPEEAGMSLIRRPTEPHWLPAFHVTFRLKSPPESWRDYLYWNIELDI